MKTFLFTLTLFIIVTICRAQYCPAHSTNIYSWHQLLYFQFDSLINITSDVNPKEYNDYSDSMVIRSNIKGKHSLLLSKGQDPNNPGVGNMMGVAIWIDFNNDTIFSNDEKIYSKYGYYTYRDSIEFPITALPGLHRLRVRHEWGEAPNSPCDTLRGGETEDYTINIVQTTGMQKVHQSDVFTLYPNPASDFVTLITNSTKSKDLEIKFYNKVGELIMTTNQDHINVSDLSNGIYILVITSKMATVSQKLIISR